MTALLALAALAVVWDVFYAGRISHLRRVPRSLAVLSALAGLLVAPALLAAVTTASIYGGRAVAVIAWLWPVSALLVLAQALHATASRRVLLSIGIAVTAYDAVAAATAITRWLLHVTGGAPGPLLALDAAHATVLGALAGSDALTSPLAMLVPLLAPAYPARWRLSRAVRGTVALLAFTLVAATALELPRGVATIRSYQAWSGDRLSERPAGDFAIGVKLFPDLDGPPPAPAMRSDIPLLDSLDVRAVSIVLRPGGARNVALDSLARALEPVRRDSLLVIVSLGWSADDAERLRADPAEWLAARMRIVDRVARRLRPDYLDPAHEPYGAGLSALGAQTPTFWRDYLTRAEATTRAVNRRIGIAYSAAGYDTADSALYAWAARGDSPVAAVGFAVVPSFRGGAGVDARLRAADRWMRAAGIDTLPPRARKPHWLFRVAAYPVAHGDASQERTVWRALTWATARPAVVGVVVAEPGDYVTTTGLRSASGRLRRVVPTMRRAARALREAVAP